jgi:hypothetical protein
MQENPMPVQVQSFATTDPRPAHIPTGWIIFNAPRPLNGSEVSGNCWATWEGEFHHGCHYAAVNPRDPYAFQMIRDNIALDGWVARYVTNEEIATAMETYCLENELDRSDYEWDELRTTYLRNAWNQPLTLDIPDVSTCTHPAAV